LHYDYFHFSYNHNIHYVLKTSNILTITCTTLLNLNIQTDTLGKNLPNKNYEIVQERSLKNLILQHGVQNVHFIMSQSKAVVNRSFLHKILHLLEIYSLFSLNFN